MKECKTKRKNEVRLREGMSESKKMNNQKNVWMKEAMNKRMKKEKEWKKEMKRKEMREERNEKKE